MPLLNLNNLYVSNSYLINPKKVRSNSIRLFKISGAIVGGVMSFASVASAASFSTTELQRYIQTQKTVVKAAPNSVESKMGANLLDVVRTGSTKAIGNKLPVIVKAQSGQGYALTTQLRQKGIEVQSVIKDDIYLYLYKNDLKSLSDMRLIESFSLQPTFSLGVNAIDNLMSEIGLGDNDSTISNDRPSTSNNQNVGVIPNQNDAGNLSIYANEFHKKNIYGNNIKIGIIDFGYNGYQTLQSTGVLPNPNKKAMFFNGTQSNSLNTSSGTPHGTACAEIIYNLAPNSSYYLAQIGDGKGNAAGGDLIRAIDWMVSQGVNVINFSGGGHFEQHNGNASLDKKVEEVVNEGVLWINAAGNEGVDHWGGTISDRDGNSLVDLNGNNYLEVQSYGNPFQVLFNWDDWGDLSPYENIDLDGYLINSQGKVVVRQEIKRNPNSEAVDAFIADVPKGRYAIALSTNKVSSKKLHVLVNGAKLIDFKPQGSIGVPATSKAALSVGAWDVVKKDIANYSSRGKTDDNRLKPEIVAPTNVLSKSYLNAENRKRFTGTSAAAPYATGFAALVWSANPKWSTSQVNKFIQRKAVRPISNIVPNVDSGYGIIDARLAVGSSSAQNSGASGYTPGIGSPSSSTYSDVPVNPPQNDDAVQNILDSFGL